MRAPPLLAAAALALWGLAFEHWMIAGLLILLVESAHLATARITITPSGYRKLGLMVRFTFVAALIWHISVMTLPQAMLATLAWMPPMFAVLVIPQLYSVQGTAPITVLRTFRANDAENAQIDLSYPYVGLTLLASAGAPPRASWFYFALAAIVMWALVAALHRARGVLRLARVVPLLAIAIAIGFGIQWSLRTLQTQLESGAVSLLGNWLPQHNPSDRSRTRIGDLGRVKLSDRIVMRVAIEGNLTPPILLTDAAFTRFDRGTWTNRAVQDRRILADPITGHFALVQGATPSHNAIVVNARTRERTLPLVLPLGAQHIAGLVARDIVVNDRGAARAEEPASVVQYRVSVHRLGPDSLDIADPPGPEDLEIPASLTEPLQGIVAEAGLGELPERTVPRQLRLFFRDHFRYSLFLGDRLSGARTLNEFLTRDRSGHCEYFAAATVLLLRSVGIPARYATGYSLEEWSDIDQRFVVRARHGHAWALAWVNGRWAELDTTPPDWVAAEARAQDSLLRPLLDAFGWIVARFDSWRLSGSPVHAGAVGVVVIIVVLWIVRRKRAQSTVLRWPLALRRFRRSAAPASTAPLAPLEAAFAPLGFVRSPGDSLRTWSRSLREAGALDESSARELGTIVDLYYRSRFGGKAGPRLREEATHAARRWLDARRSGTKN